MKKMNKKTAQTLSSVYLNQLKEKFNEVHLCTETHRITVTLNDGKSKALFYVSTSKGMFKNKIEQFNQDVAIYEFMDFISDCNNKLSNKTKKSNRKTNGQLSECERSFLKYGQYLFSIAVKNKDKEMFDYSKSIVSNF